MKTIFRLNVITVAVIIAAAGLIPAAASGSNSKQNTEGIIEYNLKKSAAGSVQEWIDGELTRDAGIGSEWYIIALCNHGKYDFSAYRDALNRYLSENNSGSASSRLKYALVYIAIGDKTNPYIDEVLRNSIGEQGIMSLVFGLHLLNNGYTCDSYSVNSLINELISLQHSDGGFSVTGEYGDVDVTAMTVQALSVYYNDNHRVKSSVDDALDFLSSCQLDNGGYSGYGVENPESVAQVVIALSSLGIDVCNDNRFIKNGNTVFDGMNSFILSDGSICHQEDGDSDAMATAQVFCASVAYENMKNGKSFFYIFEDKNVITKIIATGSVINETTVVHTTASEITESGKTTVFIDNNADYSNAKTSYKSDVTTESSANDFESNNNHVHLIVISVCLVSILICTVLVIFGKNKSIVFVIAVTIAVITLFLWVSGDESTDTVGYITISISCDVVKDKNRSHIPEDGIILEKTRKEIKDGDTVYDVLSDVCKENGILFSANMGYIEGIANVFEMDFGDNSGWIYFVNGESPSVGCGLYELADGDEIKWQYTCDMGRDLDIDIEKAYN